MKAIFLALAIYLVLSLPCVALLWLARHGMAHLRCSRQKRFLASLLIVWVLFVPGVLSTGMFHVFAPMGLALAVSWPTGGWHAFWAFQLVYGLVPAVGSGGMLLMAWFLWRKRFGR